MNCLKFNPSSWKLDLFKTRKPFIGYKKIYDFSWMLESIKKNISLLDRKNISVELLDHSLPLGLNYFPIGGNNYQSIEELENVDEYFKQREKYLSYIVKLIKDEEI